MPFNDWREPARRLAVSYGPPTPEQGALATHAGVDLPDDTPHDVAAALLLDALAETLTLHGPLPPTPGQLAYLHDLGHEWRLAPWRPPRHDDDADIPFLVDPAPRPLPASLVVSSVSESGRVNFRGGSGLAAWPEHVTMLARASDVWDTTPGSWQPSLFEPGA